PGGRPPPAGTSLRDAVKSMADFDALATPAVGEPSPEIELLNGQGELVKLSSFRGKPVVTLFQLADW
ncbi:MAG TPA: hypothetical protein QGH10_13565, partial [Armatimonadota bacterium]|nr:hypothetical protein [Armatimonadota bacterium]